MKRFLIFSIALLYSLQMICQSPSRPNPPKLYNDLTASGNFISQQQASQLETELENFYHNTSNQICVVIVDTLYGTTAMDLGITIFNDWGIGTKDKKNGVLVLVKPTGGPGQRDLAIVTGLGLEGAITDIETRNIRENEITPFFKNGQYFEGIQAGCKALMVAAQGEYNEKVHRPSAKGNNIFERHPVLLIFLVIIFMIIFRRRGGGGGFRGGWHGGTFGSRGWSGGSWGGGSSGGGGFGGFGGGSTGGGGSSGKW